LEVIELNRFVDQRDNNLDIMFDEDNFVFSCHL
jgi:hypothetical protein